MITSIGKIVIPIGLYSISIVKNEHLSGKLIDLSL